MSERRQPQRVVLAIILGGLLLLGARAGDLLGRRRIFVLGIAVFTAASLAADAGWADDTTIVAVALGAMLIAVFVTGQARADQPLMPLRLFADRRRAGAYAARFLFNGVLVSFYFFMTQYLQGVSDYTPLEAGLAFLPVTAAAFAAATVTSRPSRRLCTADRFTGDVYLTTSSTAPPAPPDGPSRRQEQKLWTRAHSGPPA